MVAVNIGTAKVQSGTFKLVHIIDLQNYENVVQNLEDALLIGNTFNHPLIPYLNHSIIQIKSYISRLKPKLRQKRSLDFLGTAWKWLSGTPDRHDFEIIQGKMNNILSNNNNQVIINQLSIDRLNSLTNVTNNILKVLKSEEQKDKISEFKYKLEIIKEEISNIEFAIHWAKANIVNSFILSNIELETLQNVFTKNNIPFSSIDELLTFANIKVAVNDKDLIYIISIPTTYLKDCNKLLIKPVKFKNSIKKLDFKKIIKCNNETFGLKNDCQNYNSLSICRLSEIFNITASECIPKLLISQPSTCATTNNYHIPTVEELEDDIIFLNQFAGEIEIDGSAMQLNGTFIIHHLNSSIKIEGRTYKTTQITGSKPLPALVQPILADAEEETLSLEMMKAISLKNSQIINTLKTNSNVNFYLNVILMTTTMAIISICLFKMFGKKSLKPKIEQNETQNPCGEEANSSTTITPPKTKSIHSLPFF